MEVIVRGGPRTAKGSVGNSGVLLPATETLALGILHVHHILGVVVFVAVFFVWVFSYSTTPRTRSLPP